MSYSTLLTDTCSVVRRAQGAFNPSTGAHGSPTDTPIYAGPCRVSPMSGMGGRFETGQEAVIRKFMWVFLPHDAEDIFSEDVVIVTASEDGNLVGRELVVRESVAEFSPNTAVGARWLIVEDIQEGG